MWKIGLIYRKQYIKWLIVAIIPIFASCSSDYHNVIPSGSVALVSFDFQQMASGQNFDDANKQNAIKSLFHVDDIRDCGIDFTEKVYAFESADGTFGLVAPVNDSGDMETWFEGLAKAGVCSAIKERKGYKFAVMHDNFIAGFSDNALLIMGPSVGAAQAELQRQMTKYLGAEDDDGIMCSPLFAKLDGINSPIALVAQAQALPDKFVAPFMIGAPKNTQPSDILISASITLDNDCLDISGETFSLDKQIDLSIKKAVASYKPISGKYINRISSNDIVTMLCGVNGEDYIKQLRNNESFRTMLIGLNTAIDMDKILKSINGDLMIAIPQGNGDKFDFKLIADVANTNWLADVDYWKSSCPKGTRIVDWTKPNSFHFVSDDWNTYFGVTANKQLYFGSTEQLASTIDNPVTSHLSDNVVKQIKGKRMCVIININSLVGQKQEINTAMQILRPVIGNVGTIIYSIK